MSATNLSNSEGTQTHEFTNLRHLKTDRWLQPSAMDDLDPVTREMLLAVHREVNGLKPRRGRANAFYSAVNRFAPAKAAASPLPHWRRDMTARQRTRPTSACVVRAEDLQATAERAAEPALGHEARPRQRRVPARARTAATAMRTRRAAAWKGARRRTAGRASSTKVLRRCLSACRTAVPTPGMFVASLGRRCCVDAVLGTTKLSAHLLITLLFAVHADAEGSSSGGRSEKTGVRPAKRARRPPSDEPEGGRQLAQHAAAAAAHVKAAVASSARAAQHAADGEDIDTARHTLTVPDRCKCFVAGIRFGTSLPVRAAVRCSPYRPAAVARLLSKRGCGRMYPFCCVCSTQVLLCHATPGLARQTGTDDLVDCRCSARCWAVRLHWHWRWRPRLAPLQHRLASMLRA